MSLRAPDNDTEMHIDEEGRPRFAPAKNIVRITLRQKGDVLTTLGWSYKSRNTQSPHSAPPRDPPKSIMAQDLPPLVEQLKLQVRMNVKNKVVELRTSKHTTDTGALQKGETSSKHSVSDSMSTTPSPYYA
jgi:RNA-binding protein PNO1